MVEELVLDVCENDEHEVGTTNSNSADDEENPRKSNPKLTSSSII